MEKEKELHAAAESGKVEKVKEILKANLNLNVNWKYEGVLSWNQNALVAAAEKGHDAVVAVLLAHPKIDVNLLDYSGKSALMWSCTNGHTACAKALLLDNRVHVSTPVVKGFTSVQWAVYGGHLDIVKWWIALGREMDPAELLEEATKYSQSQLVSLLKSLLDFPSKTWIALRRELQFTGKCSLRDWFRGFPPVGNLSFLT